MSRSIRVFRSLVVASFAGLGTHGLSQSPSAIDSTESATVFYASDPINARFSQAGLVRFLEEERIKPRKTPEVGPETEISDGRPVSTVKKGQIELARLEMPNTSLKGIGTGVRPEDVTLDRLPPSQSIPTGETRVGDWTLQSKVWVPGGFCHQPLYFENPMLERHGHVRFPHIQPLISGVRFFGTIPVLPYLATLRHPLDEVHTLGAYRPGTSAPALRYRAHYDSAALRNQVIATAATAVAVP